MKTLSHIAALALAAALLASGGDASASTKVAVTPFSGPGDIARQAHKTVVHIVSTRHSVVSSAAILEASSEATGDVRVGDNAVVVGRRAGADVVVLGGVRSVPSGYRLALAVHEAASGQDIGAITVPLFASYVAGGDAERIRPLLLDLIAQVDGAHSELTKTTAEEGARTTERFPLRVRAAGGVNVTRRTLRFVHQPGLDSGAGLDAAPNGGVRVDGEVSSRGKLRFGVAGGYDQSVGARIRYTGVDIPVTQRRARVGAKATLDRSRFSASASLGYDSFEYSLESRPAGLMTPNAYYGAVAAGLGGEVALRSVSVFGHANYLHVIASRGITDPVAFGAATIRGFDADGGLDVAVRGSIRVRAGFRYSRVALRFNGSGQQGREVDDDEGFDLSGAVDAVAGVYGQISFEL